MSIKTNHSTESLKPESGVLKIDASGALALPIGSDSTRPLVSAAGYIRFDSDIVQPEYFDGTTWQTITNKEYVDSKNTIQTNTIVDRIAALKLNDLSDVYTPSPADGQILSYDIGLGQFRTQTQNLTTISRLFNGNGNTLSFDLVTTVSAITNLIVAINGVTQEPYYSYTLVDSHLLVFDEAPELNDKIQVKILKSSIATDRPRPQITNISYGSLSNHKTITITATDITYGTGAKLGNTPIARIDYPSSNIMQLMVENSVATGSLWNQPQDLTLIDTIGNEFVFPKLINCKNADPYWTESAAFLGAFSPGDSINFQIGVNNATMYSIGSAYPGENSPNWLSISGKNIIGIAPQNSSPSRYEIEVTASNGSVYITKNFWLLVL